MQSMNDDKEEDKFIQKLVELVHRVSVITKL
jgi:hypothetical protein